MNTTPRKFYAADIPASGQPAKKLTPMAAHIEWLKSERNACYELCHDEQMACFDDAINHATSLLEAELEMVVEARVTAPLLVTSENDVYEEEANDYFTQNYQQ